MHGDYCICILPDNSKGQYALCTCTQRTSIGFEQSVQLKDSGRLFIMLKYTDITQNTYIQSCTVTEIMAREKCGLLAVPCTVTVT
jgi:hypothetical protein